MIKRTNEFLDKMKAAVFPVDVLKKNGFSTLISLLIIGLFIGASVMPLVTADNNPPTGPSNPLPVDGARLKCTNQVMLSVYVSDPDGDDMTVSFHNAIDGSVIGVAYGIASGTRASHPWTDLSCCTTYYWYAVADDGISNTSSATWSFHINQPPTTPTKLSYTPEEPLVNDILEVTASGSTDCDGDPIIYYYKIENIDDDWETEWSTDNTYHIQVSDAHNTFRVYAKANDTLEESGEIYEELTIFNTPPDEPLNQYPSCGSVNIPFGDVTLSVDVFDADDDALTVYFYEYDLDKSIIIDSEQEWHNGLFDNTETDGLGNLQLLNPGDAVAFGDGSDDACVLAETHWSYPYGSWIGDTFHLETNVNLSSLVIHSGFTLDTQGYTVRVSETLTNYGTITDSYSGGTRGIGGARGNRGYYWGIGNNNPPTNGKCGSSGQSGSSLIAGRGGDGGDGGGGGGAAWAWVGGFLRTAPGGHGGRGGHGGDGGGHVMVYASSLNNNGVIHADGVDGENGKNGQKGGCYEDVIGDIILAGGGGGGGSGGSGGDGGAIDIVYSTLDNSGGLSADGGNKGSPGDGGGVCEKDWYVLLGYRHLGAKGCGCGGDGGRGAWAINDQAEPGYPALDCALPGNNGIVSHNDNYYVLTGSYYQIVDAGEVVNWTSVVIDKTIPPPPTTNITITYSIPDDDTQYDTISDVPNSRYLNVSITLSTMLHSVTPVIDKITISYFPLIGIDHVNSGETASVSWTDRLPGTTYYWITAANDGHGGITWSEPCGFTTNKTESPLVISNVMLISSDPLDTDPAFGWIKISCEVTGSVDVVSLNISNPDGSWNNVTMVHSGDGVYYYNTTFTNHGEYEYFIWAVGTGGHTDESDVFEFLMPPNYDINMDRVINVLDISKVAGLFGMTCEPGELREDVNNDGVINVLDISMVAARIGETW